MKKVIFISNYIGNGGAGRVISVLADYFTEKGIKTSIVVFNRLGDEYKVNPKVEFHLISRDFGGIRGKIQRIIKLRSYLKGEPDSIIISFEHFVNMETICATRGLPNKVIVSERNTPDHLDKRIVAKRLRDILYRYANVLVCQTDIAKEYFSEKIQKHTVVIPNPIMSDLPIGNGKKEDEFVTFCRITPQKNLKMMIDAFSMILKDYPVYKLSIYGDGKSKDELISYCAEKGLEGFVSFYPFVLDIHERVCECAMFLSTSDFEGLSNSMLEAMAMGVPVVCTDCDGGGARMIIKDKENGMLVPKGDTKAFYKAMKYLLDNNDEREKIRQNALKIRDELSEERIGQQWLELI